MKEVWFYLYYDYEDIGYDEVYNEPTDLLVSDEFDSFEKAWNSMQSRKFPASPVMKGYVCEE